MNTYSRRDAPARDSRPRTRDGAERGARSSERRFDRPHAAPSGAARGAFARSDSRPSSAPRGGDREGFAPRAPRSFGGDRGSRPSFGGGDRGGRPSFGGDRGGRPSFGGDRSSRPSFGGGDRGGRSGGFRGGDRGSRPSFGGDRGGRPSFGGGRGGKRVRRYFDVSQYINRNPVKVEEEAAPDVKHQFADFGLDTRLVDIVKEIGFTVPSPIQDQIIPHIMAGRDVIGLSNTGTGKTAAFLLPLIHRTIADKNQKTIILAPTRELALQIQEEIRKLTPRMGIFSTVCVGGAPIRMQIRQLSKMNQFIVGTPGRVLDLINQGHIYTDRINTVVLDEADRMLDMGFIHDMRKILEGTPADRHTLFFSATMSKDIEALVHDFLREPVTVSVVKRDTVSAIAQDVVEHGHHDKFETLVNLLTDADKFSRVIIFGEMKHSVEKLSIALSDKGIKAVSIHGNKSQGQRQRALTQFKSGNARVLVATDVAARGIHVDNVSHVINYDLPAAYEDYIHRIGRTGRAGKGGQALTFVPTKVGVTTH